MVEGFRFSAHATADEFRRFLDYFEVSVPAVIVSTLTSAARGARKQIRKEIETVVGITAGESSKRLRIVRASPNRPRAYLLLNRKAIYLRQTPAKVNPFEQATASSRSVRYSGHVFKKGFELTVKGRRAYFWRPSGNLTIAWFPMLPAGEAIMRDGVEVLGARLFREILARRIQTIIDKKGDVNAASFFENLTAEEVGA